MKVTFDRAALTCAVMGICTLANAAPLYLDGNGATLGTTSTNAQRTWNTAATEWSTSADGDVPTQPYVDNSDVFVSAGTNGTGTFNIVVAGTRTARSVTVEEGTVTFQPAATPPTRAIGEGGITLAATANGNMTWANANGGNQLFLTASQPWTNNHATASFVVACPVRGSNITGAVSSTLTTTANGSGDILITNVMTDNAATGAVLAVNHAGPGRLQIQGATSYTGGTTISAGTLLLDNGGTLGRANLTITGGTLSAGTTGNGGTLVANITGDVAEQVTVTGSGVLDLTSLKFTLNLSGTQTLAEYVLATAAVGSANVAGTGFLSPALPAGWSLDYDGTSTNPGAIVLVNANVIPEPASMTFVGTIAAASMMGRRRR